MEIPSHSSVVFCNNDSQMDLVIMNDVSSYLLVKEHQLY